MLQLHDLVRSGSIVHDVCAKYPETEPVFQKFKMRLGCYDCPIRFAARKSGIQLDQLLVEINEEIYKRRGITS
jgi:hypothetical protein